MPATDALTQAPPAVFRVWRHRLRIEIEAAGLFQRLGESLAARRGRADPVAVLSFEAAADERRHAEACRRILAFNPSPRPELTPETQLTLGPPPLSSEDRDLYACVAMGCVTETLSTALLMEMRKRAAEGLVRDTVHSILTDEVNHGRIGWAEISLAARNRDVAWISPHIPAMIRAALASDVEPMLARAEAREDLSAWGILPPAEAQSIMRATVCDVILPGLREYGVLPPPGNY